MSRWPPRPRLGRRVYKAHGLGNDYLVIEEDEEWTATHAAVRHLCDPHRGLGSDGLVALERGGPPYRARMFNPDGSEFERSGNGLRILASHLARGGASSPLLVHVGGDEVEMIVHASDGGVHDVSVAMGIAEIGSAAVALDLAALDPDGRLPGPDGAPLRIVPVSVGNPHIVVLDEDQTEERLQELGRFLVSHPGLAHGANVQLARAKGPGSASALIWERGVGPTSASGTSACAVAVALVRSERLPPGEVGVDMPGGSLTVTVDDDLRVVLRGPVEEVIEGELAPGLLARLRELVD